MADLTRHPGGAGPVPGTVPVLARGVEAPPRRLVVLAAHPADSSGPGGRPAGADGAREVDVLLLTDSGSPRCPACAVLPDGEALLADLRADPDAPPVRRHRLALPAGRLAEHSADVVAALSEIVGHVADPGGLAVLAPRAEDPDPDHAAAARAAAAVCAAYRVRLRHPDARPDAPPATRPGPGPAPAAADPHETSGV